VTEAPAARLCRDCLKRRSDDPARCSACGSPRSVDLAAAASLNIAHVDGDAFYASVEKRDDPSLRDKPIIVGGSSRRGVVLTCCYIARAYGVRSAMPMGRALALCRDAIVVPPDMGKYARVGHEIRAMMRELTPLVEPLSIDEAFLDLTGCEAANGAGAAETLVRFARRIEKEVGVTVSVGLSECKFLAKLGSDIDKPRGFALLPAREAKAWLAPQSIGRLWGVGRAVQTRLERLGFCSIGDLQRIGEWEAVSKLGEEGRRLWRLAQGIDGRRVSPNRESKSISSETTFDNDVADKAELTRVLLAHCDRVAARLRKEGLSATGVALKLRLPDFTLRTRSRTGMRPTQLAPRLFAAARPLLDAQPHGAAYRLLGVAAVDLEPAEGADEGDLIDRDADREKSREAAIATLRDRFGMNSVQRGLAFRPSPRKS
jgi:DNA polymerase-4